MLYALCSVEQLRAWCHCFAICIKQLKSQKPKEKRAAAQQQRDFVIFYNRVF
jgi:hypothetical protein